MPGGSRPPLDSFDETAHPLIRVLRSGDPAVLEAALDAVKDAVDDDPDDR